MDSRFSWHNQKAASNLQKHGVSFEEAQTVFDDPFAVLFDDPAHSYDEQREIIVGTSVNNRLLLVAFTERDDTIRIISARQATPRERRGYESGTFST